MDKSKSLISLILIVILFFSCTDVPISNNLKILNRNLLGYWQQNDSTAISFTQSKDNRITLFQHYTYDKEIKEYTKTFNKTEIVYHTDMVINGITHHFISINSDVNEFSNFEYKFDSNGDLRLFNLNTSITYRNSKPENGVDKFVTSENLQQYISENVNNSKFYSESSKLKFRNRFSLLERPHLKDIQRINPDIPQYSLSTQFVNYKPKYGTINFDYPSEWEVGKSDSKKQAFNENYYIQPKNQIFEAKQNQVIIRIFDPVSIMEDTKSFNSTFSKSLFDEFVTQISEGIHPTISTMNYEGKVFYECSQNNTGFVTKIIGTKSENGNLYIIAMSASPNISSENNSILYKVAQSIKGAEPNVYLNKQEMAIKNWYTALAKGNTVEMQRLSCESARQANSLLSIMESLFGNYNSNEIFTAKIKNYDFSNLKYYTIGENANLAVIRVCGNITLPNGQIQSFFNLANTLGGTNLYIVRIEDGEWKICESFR